MPFVVDASVVARWLLPDERHPIATAAYSRIAIDSAVVPALLWFELRNLLIVNERRGRLDPAKTAQALRLIRALPITVDTDVDEDALMRLARTHRL
jgi:predicted nucleic acid-binding protein